MGKHLNSVNTQVVSNIFVFHHTRGVYAGVQLQVQVEGILVPD